MRSTAAMLLFAGLMIVMSTASAQRSHPVTAGGQSCVRLMADVRHASAKGYYDQIFVAQNDCGQAYNYKVCFTGAPHCGIDRIPPGSSRHLIGTSTDSSTPSLDFEWSQ